MKILIIVDDYLPKSIKVAGKMMHELALEFLHSGHVVTVVTPDPEEKESYLLSDLDGIKVLRFRSGRIKNVPKPIRLINEILLSFRAIKALSSWLQKNPHDLIIFYSPTIFWSGLVRYLKEIWKSPSYLILRDFFPQWVIDNGMIGKHSILAYLFRFYERRLYQIADVIGIQSPANLKWFSKFYPKLKNTQLLYNWASPLTNENNAKLVDIRKEYDLGDRIIFFYGGNIGHAQDMKNLLVLAERMLTFSNVQFIFLGAGDEFLLVKETITQKNLSNCLLLGSVSQDVFTSILTQIDVGLFTLHPDHKTHNFPGKILGYMQVGIPILGAVNQGNDLKTVIEEGKAGLVSLAGDHETFYQNAVTLLDSNHRKSMGKNAKKLLDTTFSVATTVEKIVSSAKKYDGKTIQR
ncbi:glycosyltransferase family 4 protein [Leptospira sp. 2 VSF19]|uniref:Glycosyltransferase family 4 protein n=1 Tax=Leptospira soteropolitanensis TaxID=2950025 RepID=A0AAW5VQ94_9LEPT|nr:glycosyltransferase family 4 protein [Leptospira soteropolitanensis]MCW7493181.1 glycosyltransferase family 4 protein [Leptospira soteropolitanensis]MCW7500750.1 glycosyltransferase family 4 protein [Leptospira soteropolitanensis]MCW7523031.1 glycosyltransferase family 4 protein [Leptospira soteropolitanensis]MCW7526862.1 glycosyltransferase family 4 protein [Leptospira soteropolitanensis]MCW7530749.1 glycosyltransferase family 4 protein [Leptospira soteropolitanensis]